MFFPGWTRYSRMEGTKNENYRSKQKNDPIRREYLGADTLCVNGVRFGRRTIASPFRIVVQ